MDKIELNDRSAPSNTDSTTGNESTVQCQDSTENEVERVSDKDRGGIKSERCLSDPSLSHEVGTSTNSSDDAALSHEVGTSTNSSDVVESRQILSEQSMNVVNVQRGPLLT